MVAEKDRLRPTFEFANEDADWSSLDEETEGCAEEEVVDGGLLEQHGAADEESGQHGEDADEPDGVEGLLVWREGAEHADPFGVSRRRTCRA